MSSWLIAGVSIAALVLAYLVAGWVSNATNALDDHETTDQ